jgi:hypothetical protein
MNEMSLYSRVRRIESVLNERNKPTHEQMVCDYFNSMWAFFDGEGEQEVMLQNYEKVKDRIPSLHD